ncbi:MAG: hypothetical protein ACYC61_05155 [Isosphaeraceae bacterium]
MGTDRPPGGAGFSVIDRILLRDPSGPRVRRDVTVGPGGAVELGDTLIARSREGKNTPWGAPRLPLGKRQGEVRRSGPGRISPLE